MGETSYVYEFVPGQERRRFELLTSRGKLLRFTVQYETFVRGKWYGVIRYDASHGFMHKDVLDKSGNVIEKIPLGEMGYKAAIRIAVADIGENWAEHKKTFLKSSKGSGKND